MAQRRYPTKIIPPDYERVFERKRLFALIEQRKTAELIWVNGSPGAGKTVLVASFLKNRGGKFLWYRVDSNERDFSDIFYFLPLAVEKNYPGVKFKLPVFTAEYADDIENFARVFFRELFAVLTQESAIVLDNCQELEQDPKFFRLLQIATDQLPQGLQLICISRNRPGMELGRLSLTGRLLEIGDADLRFIEQESNEFIHWLEPNLIPEQVLQIQSKALGWSVALVMMTRQMAIPDWSENPGAGESLFNYLMAETLSNLPKPLQAFLTANAIFNQFTIDMSKELIPYHQAKSDLDTLVFKNLLIERTRGVNPTYRLHPLFRDLLLAQAANLFIEPQWRALQQKAAQILVQQDRIVEALIIYQQLSDWPTIHALLLQEAPRLIDTGRYRTLRPWLERLPNEYLATDPWLNYWYALTIKPSDPLQAENYLEKSYQLFVDTRDVKGIYSTWIAAVESLAIGWDDTAQLMNWINRFDDIRRNYPNCPSIELKIQFYSVAILGLSIANPQHAWIRGLIRICERVFYFIPIKAIKSSLAVQMGHYYILTTQLSKLKNIVVYLESILEDKSLPAILRILSSFILGINELYLSNSSKAANLSNRGLEIGHESGIRIFEKMLLTNFISSHIINMEIQKAESVLWRAMAPEESRRRGDSAMIYAYAAWIAALSNSSHQALEQVENALGLSRSINLELGYVCALSMKAQVLAELSQWEKAKSVVSLLSLTIKDTNNQFNSIQYLMADAWIAYQQKNYEYAKSAVEAFLQILSSEQIYFFFNWRPQVLLPLCQFAIENNVEKEFSIRLLQRYQRFLASPMYLEQWPWPVRIYSFGALEIVVNGESVKQSGKGQKKVIELLEMLISLGGSDVHCDRLAEALWPDSEGDLARQTLETTLHRLRKFIGKDAVLLNNGLLSLNSNYCWLDLWAFKTISMELEQALVAEEKQRQVIDKLTDRLLKLYRGPFLRDNESGSIILMQEQLFNKLNHLIDLVINVYQADGILERVHQLLLKQLELNPLVEANYRRLMKHYADLGQLDKAMQIYQQCQRVLCEGFNISLSNDIRLLAKQIQKN